MSSLLAVALANLLSPAVLFFALGFAAAVVRSDLAVPETVAKGLALYLMLAIGFKGGVAVRGHGADAALVAALLAGAVLSAGLPLLAYPALRRLCGLRAVDAAAVAAHYGSVSVVTFVAGTAAVNAAGLAYEGFMVAVVAVMETPAIVVGLWLAQRGDGGAAPPRGELVREVVFNGSVVLLMGSFAIGALSGADGMIKLAPFVEAPFQGVLCLFLLDMGLVAARQWRAVGGLGSRLVAFGLLMPPVGAAFGLLAGLLCGLSPGGTALLATLSGSASYIAVPAAMRLALPRANPALYLTLSLAVTFPFNLAIGIPLYLTAAQALALSPSLGG